MYLIFLLIGSMVFQGCNPSPRYASNPSKKKYKKQSKKNKHKKKQVGISSYYGTQFHGKLTANGEVFDMYGVTAAHRTLPLGTVARL